jgi:hypothetical protein
LLKKSGRAKAIKYPVVEASVVGLGEGDDHVARILHEMVDRNAASDEDRRREHGDELMKQVRHLFKQVGHG